MRRVPAVVLLLAALVLPACSRINSEKDGVLAAVYRTEAVARAYDYDERPVHGGASVPIAVRGAIADDYRYRADAYVYGQFGLGVVVSDDARALRFARDPRFDVIDPALAQASSGGVEVPPEGNPLLVAVRGRWVVDRRGASSLWHGGPSKVALGDDPVYDSLTVLRYVRQAVGEAAFVAKFNPESQDYRPKFDPFPAPGRGEIRYDLLAPSLKPRDPTTTSGKQLQIPGPRFFRRMSVYVRDGAVVTVREKIDVADMLADPRSHLVARIADYEIELPEAPPAEQAAVLVRELNGMAKRLSLDGLREREMTVSFKDLGRPQRVELPTGAEPGSLKGVLDYGQVLFERAG